MDDLPVVVTKSWLRIAKRVGLVLVLAWVFALAIGFAWDATRGFENGPGAMESIVTAVLAFSSAILVVRYWPSVRAWNTRRDMARLDRPMEGPGDVWYPDPTVTPPRWRRWDGSAWTTETRTPRGYLYGMCMPVTGKVSRIWNAVMALFVFFVFAVGTQSAFHHLFPIGDPDTVYVDPLHRVVRPKTYIKAHCPNTVRSVDHLIGSGGRHALFLQVWSVDPFPGHVDRAFFDPSTGVVTCP